MFVTLAVALAGGHGWGLVNWARTKLGDNPEKWDWQQAGIMFVCALAVWGFAVLTGHTVGEVGTVLQQPENAGFVTVLVIGADRFVNLVLMKAGKGPWAPEAPKPAP